MCVKKIKKTGIHICVNMYCGYTCIFSFVYTFIDFVYTYEYILCACFHVCLCFPCNHKEYG